MKKNLFKLLFVMLFLLTVSFTFVYNNNTNVLADETETEEVVKPSLNIYKKNISYASEIYIMYAVSYEGIDVTTNPVKMLFYNSVQDEYTTQTASYVVSSQGSVNIGGVSCQIFASNGLAAKQMTDDIYARAYVEIGEETIYSDVVKYSVLEYYYEIKEAGTVSTNILNLLEAMVNYGAAAQTNFNYNTEKLANATYYKVNVENAVLPDGFTSGRFKAEEQVTLTAPLKEGYVFKNWTNANGDVVSTESTYTLTVTQDETLTANYEEEAGVILTLTKEAAYDATASTLDLPSTVTFDYNNETVTENVTWDIASFVVNKIGKQKLYGTLSNDSYKVNELSIEIDVLPYTFSLNEETNEYSITKYYGTAEEETIPATFNNISIVEIKQYAFENVLTIKNLIIPTTICKIEQSAIYGCNSLESITIPFIGSENSSSQNRYFGYIFGATTYLDNKSFVPSSLKYVKILEGATIVGTGSFRNCENILSVSLPETIISIAEAAFANCKNIENIKIPSSVEHVYNYVFSGCDKLTSIELATKKTTFFSNAFDSCVNLKNVYYYGTVEDWLGCYFYSAKSTPMNNGASFYMLDNNNEWYEVTEIVVPDTITEISNFQFYGFENLTNIVMSKELNWFGNYAFSLCENLMNVYYDGTIESWCDSSFTTAMSSPMFYAEHFYMKNEEGNWYEVTEIVIPNTITEIGNYQLYGFENVTHITIPNSVISIGNSAFYDCKNLLNIEIPNGVTTIPANCFYSCLNLKSITISNSITSVGGNAFYECKNLTQVYYEGTIESWCNIPFYNTAQTPMSHAKHFYMKNEEGGWYELKKLVIPNTITKIGNYQFYGFENVTSITISNSVTTIGNNAFAYCSGVSSLIIPSNITIIMNNAFNYCRGLTNITILGNNIFIEGSAFYGCSQLVLINNYSNLELTIGSTNNGYVAYHAKQIVNKDGSIITNEGCSYIITDEKFMFLYYDNNYSLVAYLGDEETITLPANINGYDYEISNFKGGKNIIIPEGMTSISSSAFFDCYSLVSITIPSSVTSIGYAAFNGCRNLISIIIPENVVKIDQGAFRNCDNLTSVVLPNSLVTIGYDAFQYCYNLKTVYNLSDLKLTIGSTNNGYVAYYAEVIYTTLPEEE